MSADFAPDFVPVALNLHLTARCNYTCKFCWAPFVDVPGSLDKEGWLRLIEAVARDRGLFGRCLVDKITFAGGEPTLLPFLPDLIRAAKQAGFTTCVVTNGTGITKAFLAAAGPWLDWITVSLDSGDEAVNAEMGRGRGRHVANIVRAVALIREHGGPRVRMNTVVTAATWSEDLKPIVSAIAPERWKVLQGTRIRGQNDDAGDLLDVTPAQFESFIERHRVLNPVVEATGAILGAYLMIDPLGRVFSNTSGRYVYGPPVLDVGLARSAVVTGWEPQRFINRGGVWPWRPGGSALDGGKRPSDA